MDWKIWTRKVVNTTLAVLIAGGISVFANDPYWLATLPILVAIQNWLKHK